MIFSQLFSFVLWTAQPEVLASLGIDAGFDIRWYGLLFATGFLIGQAIMSNIYKTEGKPDKDMDAIVMYMIIGVVAGARLGHCLFYEPDVYLADPIRILKIWEGGLASHGATAGILIAIWLYSRKRPHLPYLWVLDRIVITVALGGALIRIGNLMNSEIVGKPTDASYAFVFARPAIEEIKAYGAQVFTDVKLGEIGEGFQFDGRPRAKLPVTVSFTPGVKDTAQARRILTAAFNTGYTGYSPEVSDHLDLRMPIQPVFTSTQPGAMQATLTLAAVPRHPAQLYESITTFLVFLLLYGLWRRQKAATPQGSLFGLFVTIVFGLRFCYEFLKENQVDFENELPLNMGQWLSLPLIPVGLAILIWSYRRRPQPEKQPLHANVN